MFSASQIAEFLNLKWELMNQRDFEDADIDLRNLKFLRNVNI